MTSTLMREKTRTEQEEWTRVFPMDATKTYLNSVNFLKKLTVVTLSTLTYVRNFFPESSYKLQSFGGNQIRILKESAKCELSTFLSTSLIASFDAFEKKYLKHLALCVYEDESRPETLIESYIFTYKYNNQDVSISFHKEDTDTNANASSSARKFPCTLETIKQTTSQMLRSCMVAMQTVQPLPPIYDLSLRLYYYDEVTPADYSPEGFASDSRNDKVMMQKIQIGRVITPHHIMRLCVSDIGIVTEDDEKASVTTQQSEQIISVDGIEIRNTPSAETVLINSNASNKSGQFSESSLTILFDERSVDRPKELDDMTSRHAYETFGHDHSVEDCVGRAVEDSVGRTVGDSVERAAEDSVGHGVKDAVASSVREEVVRCPCNMTNESNDYIELDMIVCRECGTSQHSVCSGLMSIDAKAIQSHVCLECALERPELAFSNIHLKRMLRMPQAQRVSICLYRRVLWWCAQLQSVNVQTFAANLPVSEDSAFTIMRRLEKHGVVMPLPPLQLRKGRHNVATTRRTIDSRKLKREVLPKFFITNRDEEAPSVPASQQHSGDDQLEHLLSPEEQMYDIERRIQQNIHLDENHNHQNTLERNMHISSNREKEPSSESADMEIETEQAETNRNQKKSEADKKDNIKVSKVTKRKIQSDQKVEPRPKRKCIKKVMSP